MFQRVLARFVVFVKAVRHAAVGCDIATLDEPLSVLFDRFGILTELPDPVAYQRLQPFVKDGTLLDRYYIPTRYPNGLPDLTPGQVYFRKDAELCLESSHRLLLAVEEFVGETGNAR